MVLEESNRIPEDSGMVPEDNNVWVDEYDKKKENQWRVIHKDIFYTKILDSRDKT